MAAIHDSVGKFCPDNWTERKMYQPMVQNKLLSTIQAYSLGFLTGNPMPWKRFWLFCLFHASLSIVACSVQLVYTKFPNRVIHRALRVCRTRSRDPGYFVKEHNRRWPRYIGPYGRPDEFVKGHDRAQNDGRTNMNEQATKRLTMAQAIIAFLKNQYVERDGREQPFFAGCFGIFGHGNIAGIGQALQQMPEFRYYQARNEQAMVHITAAYAKPK